MTSDNSTEIPSTPNPGITQMVFNLLRCLLMILGALGISFSWATNSNLEIIASGVVTLIGIIWAIWAQISAAIQAHKNAVASAQASAKAGVPKAIQAP